MAPGREKRLFFFVQIAVSVKKVNILNIIFLISIAPQGLSNYAMNYKTYCGPGKINILSNRFNFNDCDRPLEGEYKKTGENKFFLIPGVKHPDKLTNDLMLSVNTSGTDEDTVFDKSPVRTEKQSGTDKDFTRSTLEIAAVLGIGMLIYQFNESNKQDYMFEPKEALRVRLTDIHEALRYDTNNIYLNAGAHPFAGGLYYFAPRRNGFNFLESALFAIAGSTTWEYLYEYREVLSINDLIITPLAGIPTGEVFFQLIRFFADKDGHEKRIWRNFNYSAGYAQTAGKSREHLASLGLDMEFFPGIRGFNKKGLARGFFFNGPYARFNLESKLGAHGMKTFHIYMETSWLAYANGKIEKNKVENREGFMSFLGLNIAFEFDQYKIDSHTDQLGIAHIAGPAADVFFHINGIEVRMRLSVFGDYACVQSFALPDYLISHSSGTLGDSGNMTLKSQGYYYGYGSTGSGKITVRYKNFQAGIDAIMRKYYGLNVREDDYPDPKYSLLRQDERLRLKASLMYLFPEWDIILAGQVTHNAFLGRVGDTTTKNSETIHEISVIYSY